MALELATAVVNIVGNESPLVRSLARTERETGKSVANIQAKLRKIGDTMAKVGRKMTMFVTLPLVAGAGLAVRAFMQQEAAEADMESTLKSLGHEVAGNLARFKGFAAEMQKATVYGDEFTLGLMTQALNLGSSTDALEQNTKMSIGLAKALKMDVATALRYTILATQGEFTMLNRYLPALRATDDATEKMAIVTNVAAAGFKQAEDYAKTAAGRFKQLGNDMGDVAEKPGKVLADCLVGIVAKLKELSAWLNKQSPAFWKVVVAVGALVAVISPLLLGLGLTIKATLIASAALHTFAGASARATVSTWSFLASLKAMNMSGLMAAGTMTKLGVAGLALGVAIAGFQLGKWAAEWLGIDKAIQSAATSMNLFGGKTARIEIDANVEAVKKLAAERKKAQDARAARTGISEADRQAKMDEEVAAKAKARLAMGDKKTKQIEDQTKKLKEQLSITGALGLWEKVMGKLTATDKPAAGALAGGVAGAAPKPDPTLETIAATLQRIEAQGGNVPPMAPQPV